MKKCLLALGLVSFFTGCANVVPQGDASLPYQGKPIVYKIPTNTKTSLNANTPLEFKQWGTENYFNPNVPSTAGVKYAYNNAAKTLSVRRFETNGVAGSWKEYSVSMTSEVTGDTTTIKFSPLMSKSHQDGLILPFPVPPFTDADIVQYLTSAKFTMKFEVNSQYNSESVHASFKRLLKYQEMPGGFRNETSGKIYKSLFVLPVKGASVQISVETYPYQNGAKAVIEAFGVTSTTSENEVDVKAIESEIIKRVTEIVNS